ncbi:MAG: hypothetical protein B7X39_08595 [Lysobacterales bacterium 14-68-21]|jgi:outer membrane protein|nr:MAG: hypothetical protein B7X45_05915 [Xanthomonadales bacterium 15-68-25]OZB66746.1 MAG: hypothetical protein B7X39_08595 [Xanthomonadales bacterium 14-68-21]
MKASALALTVLALAFGTASAAHAADTSPWVFRVGVHTVNPKSNNGTLAGMKATIDSDTKPTFSLEYMFDRNWGVDVLAALPFKHTVRLNGVSAATTKHLPPTVGVNYHFMPDATVSPFVGVGLNYTRFFETRGVGPLQGAHVSIANSFGAAAHAGLDFRINDRWLATADVRWMSIAGDVKVNGTKVGKANIDPLAYGLSIGYRF